MFITDRKFILAAAIFLLAGQTLYGKFVWVQGLFWSDILMHFIGGVFVAAIFLNFFQNENKPALLLFTVSFAVLIGVLWEFYEYLAEYYFSRLSGFSVLGMALDDTLSDLFFDLLGGLTAGIIRLRPLWKRD